jgi:hypothetical protein
MKHRLNGAQRTWIVLALVSLGFVLWWGSTRWPSAEFAMERRVVDTEDLIWSFRYTGENRQVTDPALQQHLDRLSAGPPETIREKNARVPGDQQRYADRVNFGFVEQRYHADLALVAKRRAELALKCLGIWMLPQVLIAASVATGRWVRAGYKGS